MCLAALFLVLAIYWQTVFFGQPISKLGYLPQSDAFFSPTNDPCTWHPPGIPWDASAALLFYPYETFVHNSLSHGVLPLWNDLSGCGFSMIGAITSRMFCPLNVLLPITNQYLFNLRIVLCLWFGVSGMIVLARRIGCSPLASMLAGSSFVLCPFLLRETELPNGYWLFPWIFYCLLATLERGGITRIFLSACLIAFAITSAHPECMFFAIAAGSAFSLVLAGVNSEGNCSWKQRLGRLVAIGLFAGVLSAPVLLPFLEYLSNAYNYKGVTPSPWACPMANLIISFVQPIFGWDSLSIGCVAAVCFFFASLSDSPVARRLFWMVVALVVFAVRIFPLDSLLSRQPLVGLYPMYCFPALLIIMLLLSGIGFDLIMVAPGKKTHGRLIWITTIGVTLLLCTPYSWLAKLPGPEYVRLIPTLPPSYFLIENAAILALFLFLVVAAKPATWSNKYKSLLLVLNLLSLLSTGMFKLIETPQFTQHSSPITTFIRSSHERMIAIDWCFLANLPSCYDIKDFRMFDALYPRRFVEFMKICGASCQSSVFWIFNGTVRPLIDAASVKYVVCKSSPGNISLEKVLEQPNGMILYRNKNSFPPAYFAKKVYFVPDLDRAIKTVSSNWFDPRAMTIMEGGPVHTNNEDEALIAPASGAVLARPDSNHVHVSVNLKEPAWLVLTDSYYPGWKASIDGNATKIYPTNILFRSVLVPAGSHEILFSYEPFSFSVGVFLFVSGLVVFSVCSFVKYRQTLSMDHYE
ncbi:MAG: hypothetical protein C5B53_12085 [Candidatus Melainabacteria bacterium]|nr:MAG: hypothetical protein C5B53_12085 [Candidatus Melainabacteria bacterium]